MMAGLSSNWKKLQAKLSAENTSKPSHKRKADSESAPQPKKTKISKTTTQVCPARPKRSSEVKSKIPMGGVQSAPPKTETKQGVSLSLALWATDNDISAESIAEAYDLGLKDPKTVLAAEKDKINHDLCEDVTIGKYVAIDCEMVGVGPGGHDSVLARVSIVDFHGKQIYDSYVKPREKVTNWRTAVSGISPKQMRFARDFDEVQKDVAQILDGRILVGHDLKHDLECLALSHPVRDIRDTAKFHNFRKLGNGRKPALRILAQELLGVEIQSGAHSSIEDARVTMLLFRKHKPGFDVDHANRFAPRVNQASISKGSKVKKKK
ncbi:ribonuclease H-like domain-containing protein [Emericellopsis atlantica]|uniref:RNA exonuclease 4 n=1 Tax=Emericellopsis atlantica TaxID=2614577 RepID=A0A9P7ZHC3_9HYPO|nr:ribonuclease H-like domain-containing protein [Emericellopsis atlantica]KAG9251842.1 ribonuclease H-like domain-containing protein [Emericellopsis atlantica]